MIFRYVKYPLRAVVAVVLLCVVAGCYNRFDPPATTAKSPLVANITIEQLHTLLSAEDQYIDISSDLTIVGSVTAHDAGGNFYKSFVIEQDGYAVEILEGLTDSYVRHDLGYQIAVKLKGLRLGRRYGMLQVGVATEAGSYYNIDYMGHEYLVDQHIKNSGILAPVTPKEYSFEEITSLGTLSTSLCGGLIRVSGLRYFAKDTDSGLWAGTHSFISVKDPLLDGKPQSVINCYTSSYASFAEMLIPITDGAITAILQFDQTSGTAAYSVLLKPRDSEDLKF